MLTQHVANFWATFLLREAFGCDHLTLQQSLRHIREALSYTRAAEAVAYPAGHRFSGDGARQQSFHFVTLLRAAVRLHSAP